MDGFYAAYLSGIAGVSTVLFVLREGKLVGVDVGGLKYDGVVEAEPDGSGYVFSVVYVIPAGQPLITGGAAPEPITVPLTLELPNEFADGRVIGIVTPLGPVNAKFAKLREL